MHVKETNTRCSENKVGGSEEKEKGIRRKGRKDRWRERKEGGKEEGGKRRKREEGRINVPLIFPGDHRLGPLYPRAQEATLPDDI